MSFHEPSVWFLFLGLLAPLVWWRWVSVRRRSAVTFSSVSLFRSVGASWAVRGRWLLPILRTIAVLGLVVCIARPQVADKQTEVRREGIAIELIVDRSGSMAAMDLAGRRDMTRLDVAKDALERFVLGDEANKDDEDSGGAGDFGGAGGAGNSGGGGSGGGRPNDLIGLVIFGTFADSICPMTLDHAHLAKALRQTEVAYVEAETQTAIGDAIALGVERLRSLSDASTAPSSELQSRGEIASRVIILLTDGANNIGDVDPITAAQMAQAFGIRIYTVGVGSNRRDARTVFRDADGRLVRGVVGPVDEATLAEIASITGGTFFRATDADSLSRVYEIIDELEKTEIQEKRFTEYYEPAVESVEVDGRTWPPLLLIVMAVLALEIALSCTRIRPLP